MHRRVDIDGERPQLPADQALYRARSSETANSTSNADYIDEAVLQAISDWRQLGANMVGGDQLTAGPGDQAR